MRGVLAVEDWAEIRRLHRAEGLPIRAIGRRLGVSRNAVRRALASEAPPRYSRPARGSAVDGFEPAIRVLLAEFPEMPASVIAERVGWVQVGECAAGAGGAAAAVLCAAGSGVADQL